MNGFTISAAPCLYFLPTVAVRTMRNPAGIGTACVVRWVRISSSPGPGTRLCRVCVCYPRRQVTPAMTGMGPGLVTVTASSGHAGLTPSVLRRSARSQSVTRCVLTRPSFRVMTVVMLWGHCRADHAP